MTIARHLNLSLLAGNLCLLVAVACGGCSQSEQAFPLNAVWLKKQELATRTQLTAEQKQDLADLLEILFGTPNQPRLPPLLESEFARLFDLDRLRAAAGPVGSDQQGRAFGLFRANCAPCHGISGDGAGPTAALLEPYPRDFRRGLFKFKTTPGAVPPTDEDLARILKQGVPGTAMPSFRLLDEDERAALVQYVKYLAVRGEFERALIFECVDQLEPHQRLVRGRRSLKEFAPADLVAQVEFLQPLLADLAQKWREAPQQVTEVPPRPTTWEPSESIARGRELFLGKVANCVKCHGETGRGDGQTTDYDEWAKEIIDLQNPATTDQYVALGALPPQNIRPRDMRHGVFRGGRDPRDLYRRIDNGITGTPMPPAALKPAGAAADDQRLTPEDIWHLVDFVLDLSQPDQKGDRHRQQ